MKVFDVAVVGGGASGLVAAIAASKGGRKVIIIEKNDRIGKKILASGNGRCNLSNKNLVTDTTYVMYNNRKFVTYALNSIDNAILRSFLESVGLLSTYEGDRMYPYSFNSSQVIDVLRQAVENNHITLKLNTEVEGVTKANNVFTIKNSSGKDICAQSVIIATGSGAGQEKELKYFLKDHNVVEPMPSLLPIRTDIRYLKGLNGIRSRVRISLFHDGEKLYSEVGEVLFKNFGISGVCTFSASSYIARNIRRSSYDCFKIKLDFMPEYTEKVVLEKLLSRSNIVKEDCTLENIFVGLFHKNIALNIIEQAGYKRDMHPNYEILRKIAYQIKNFELQVIGLPPMSVAQVASGGYDVKNFSKHSFESRVVSGLYVVGEALDIDGICGGYNLHFAFASGLVAGRKVGEYLDRSF
ncbi:MAG: aminoacetone oxidase family FAD-binding enzyme [Clostridia bacterium]|nr:aminoacetone oxidase family FAD-binding enzyme [Clostridia bacterium]MDY5264544.1 aminoacetone oxidase family FAD-binding enzyme [Eubacteriales bacterium]MDY5440151.1 aminoacetone oxidase family FAD-binding enzyme [Eubacteriales bacterium]